MKNFFITFGVGICCKLVIYGFVLYSIPSKRRGRKEWRELAGLKRAVLTVALVLHTLTGPILVLAAGTYAGGGFLRNLFMSVVVGLSMTGGLVFITTCMGLLTLWRTQKSRNMKDNYHEYTV